ncbi:hypothetical protein ASE14_18340 [Agromyces sp. Root81]|uniref:hypothetical protein n=1 Tax=Agromyces sp. Root81 TaxID=1736601 RepID=UPI0006FAEC74|nr:hypothetical protein [Agromyces sp. Root81]KRC58536.1 hypothetical protein ASE14_18340 [Agromyces sp. Root81]
MEEPIGSPELERELLVMREDDLDDADYQVREVYAQYGLTNYSSQVLEKGILNTLVLKANSESPTPTAQNFDVLFAKYARLPFGQLLASFQKALPAETEAYDVLARALPLRNFIAHTFFWDRAVDFHSFSGREAMLSELMKAREVFESADALVNQVTRRVAAAAGIDADTFDRRLAEATDDLHARIPTD